MLVPVLPCQMQPASLQWLGKDNCTVLVLFGQCPVCPEHHSDTLPCFYLSLNQSRGGICQIANFCGFWRMPSAHPHAASGTLLECPVPLPHPAKAPALLVLAVHAAPAPGLGAGGQIWGQRAGPYRRQYLATEPGTCRRT